MEITGKDILIDAVQEVERSKLAISKLKYNYENGYYCYIAGSLILDINDPFTKSKFIVMNVKSILGIKSEIIREAQYYTSLLYVKFKGSGCSSFKQAEKNVEEYERIGT